MHRVGVVGNAGYRQLEEVMGGLRGVATELGADLFCERSLAAFARGTNPALEEAWDRVDWVLTLGGDGTLLRGARAAGPRGLPVLGCNLGRLGFLTMVPQDGLEEAFRAAAAGEYEEELRQTLEVCVRRADDGGETAGHGGFDEAVEPIDVGGPGDIGGSGDAFYSVNDAVIHKAGFARMITLRVWADDEEVGQYSADGIIIATATGSTAYSLSAGGPILVPTADGIVATPISPHTLAVRPVVLPGSTRVRVEIAFDGGDLALTVDGQTGSALQAGDRVEVERSRHPVRLLRPPGHSFFAVLRAKLHWGDVRTRGRGERG